MRHRLIRIKTAELRGPHEPTSPDKVEDLARKLSWGWDDYERPLVILGDRKVRGKYQSLTGSHRIVAAKKARLQYIPCLVLNEAACRIVRQAWSNPRKYLAAKDRAMYRTVSGARQMRFFYPDWLGNLFHERGQYLLAILLRQG